MTDKLTPAQIHSRLVAGAYGDDALAGDDFDPDGDLGDLIDKHTEPAVTAYAVALMDYDPTEPFSLSDFTETFGNRYRQSWDSPGAFAACEAEAWADENTLEKLTAWVDWEEMAAGPELSDFTFIHPREDNTFVYVFEMDG